MNLGTEKRNRYDTPKKVVTRLVLWLIEEVVLTSVGLDDLADFEEYLRGRFGILSDTIYITFVDGERSSGQSTTQPNVDCPSPSSDVSQLRSSYDNSNREYHPGDADICN